tara:strand:- start:1605 stop:1847 length:243 start_codon:yes stop_codon:yes gene_type:complete
MPFALTQGEAAALCAVSVGYFQAHCPVIPMKRGNRLLYPSDEVKVWFREHWLAQTGQSENDAGPAGDWTGRFNDDDQDAA